MPIDKTPAIEWLIRNWEELLDYNFQWIAATEQGLVANSPNLDDVIDSVVEGNLEDQVAFALVDLDEPVT